MKFARLKFATFNCLRWASGSILLLILVLDVGLADSTVLPDAAGPELRQEVIEWRQRREDRLRSEHGWLSLVALEWLKEGENRIGHSPENDIQLPGGPDYWGTILLEGETLGFRRAENPAVTVNGEMPEFVELVPDVAGEATVVQSGSMAFQVIHRESYALRVSDSQAPTRVNFRGLDYFEIQPDWVVEGEFHAAAVGETIDIANVLGQVTATAVYGTFEFVREGAVHRLIALVDESSEAPWFIFADRTNGKTTYGAGRFLHSEGLPEGGRLLVDFNKSYNPPCAFSDYSTCPLPPPQNRLDLAVSAGEKQFHALPAHP